MKRCLSGLGGHHRVEAFYGALDEAENVVFIVRLLMLIIVLMLLSPQC